MDLRKISQAFSKYLKCKELNQTKSEFLITAQLIFKLLPCEVCDVAFKGI